MAQLEGGRDYASLAPPPGLEKGMQPARLGPLRVALLVRLSWALQKVKKARTQWPDLQVEGMCHQT